jgi:hypothetical protein
MSLLRITLKYYALLTCNQSWKDKEEEKKFNEKERKRKIKLPKKVSLECLHILDVVNNYKSFELTASLLLPIYPSARQNIK